METSVLYIKGVCRNCNIFFTSEVIVMTL